MFGLLKKKIMYIDVRIPFDEKGKLSQAYNIALANGISEWVLFLDQDVFLCNPHWYDMCNTAILTAGVDPMAAAIGCECGGEYFRKDQVRLGDRYAAPNADINHHIEVSKEKYHEYGNMIQRIHVPVPGFFMLLKREIATKIGFKQWRKGINNIDTDFGVRLMRAGYHIYQMRGLYIYHRRGMRHLKKDFIIQGDES